MMKNEIDIDSEYQLYRDYSKTCEEPDMFLHVDDPQQNCTRIMTKEEFIWALNNDEKTKKYWTFLKTL